MTKPAFVLVHGWGLNEEVWGNLIEPLSIRFDVQTLSLPGYGKRHTELSPPTLDALADDLLAQAPASAIWCGWSLGGMAALCAAIKQPARFQSLNLLCTTPKFVGDQEWNAGTDLDTFRKFAQDLIDNYQRGIQRFLLLQSGTAADAKRMAKEASKALHKHPAPSSQTLMSGLDILESADLRAKLASVDIPCHVIAGRRDRVVSPEACVLLAEGIRGARYTELNSGHAPHLSHPEKLVSLILDQAP